MSKKTNPRQRMIAMMREHFADANTTITESKLLADRVTGQMREVDVVIEGIFAGDETTIGVEVVEHSRRKGIEWVERMIGKHENLPTDRLILISWSGFTDTAVTRARLKGITTLTPEKRGEAAQKLYVDQVTMSLVRCMLTIQKSDRSTEVLDAPPELAIFALDGSLVGSRVELVSGFMEMSRELVDTELHNCTDRAKYTHLTVGDTAFGRLGLYVENVDAPSLEKLTEIACTLAFTFAQTELAFDVMQMDGKDFGGTVAPFFDRDAVWVVTQNDADPSLANISYRTVDAPSEPQKGLRGRDDPPVSTDADDDGSSDSAPTRPT